eukprot:46970-Amorphochlora_amoeboformis.AAC.1
MKAIATSLYPFTMNTTFPKSPACRATRSILPFQSSNSSLTSCIRYRLSYSTAEKYQEIPDIAVCRLLFHSGVRFPGCPAVVPQF